MDFSLLDANEVSQMAIGVDKAVTGRLKVNGQKFEILVDPDGALKLKRGEPVKVADILAYPVIYKDTSTSEEASQSDVQTAFGTNDPLKAAERIILKGEIQLTTEQRRTMTEQKKNQIAALISKKGINPQTNTPHPPQRIIGVMDQVGAKVDPFQDAESQIDGIVSMIKTVIPIKFEKMVLQVKVPPQHAGRAFPAIKSSGTLKGEKWLDDGSLQAEVEILAGVQEEFLKKLADATKGEYESKIIKTEDV